MADSVISGHPTFDAAAVTHRGHKRKMNEDAIWIDGQVLKASMDQPFAPDMPGPYHMILVADGMGGHASGEVASLAVLEYLSKDWEHRTNAHSWAEAIKSANDHIYDLMSAEAEHRGMGSTIVGAVFSRDLLIHFNVGDSRAYLCSPTTCAQISHDDTPRMPPNAGVKRTHMITQSLGGRHIRTPVMPHVAGDAPLQSGDTLVLCSDGLTDMVDDAAIFSTIRLGSAAEITAAKLLELALNAGGDDNISIIVVRAT